MDDELIIQEKKSLYEVIVENKDFLYPILFYIAGIFAGSMMFKNISKVFNLTSLNELSNNFNDLFINNFCIYFSIFTVTIFLGLCLIGYPVINIIPLLIGIEFSLKICYYYVNYSIKGIGYCVLMLIPEASCLVTVIVYSIRLSSNLSKYIFRSATKKSDMIEEINLKSYLKSFVLYALIVVVISLFNALLNYLLGSIVSI